MKNNPLLEKLKSLPPETTLTAMHIAAVVSSLLEDEDYDKAPSSKLIDEQKLADWLNESVSTIQKWRVKGDGPKFVKNPKSIRYKVGDVRDWIERRTVSSTSEATVKGLMKWEITMPIMQYGQNVEIPFFQSLEIDDEPDSYRIIKIGDEK